MSQRRMFSKEIVESDAFLDMPLSAQALYLHLSMNADDDGVVNAPSRITRMVGGSPDDLKILIAKKFLIHFDDIEIIKAWRINNYIQKDRYTPSKYQKEMKLLSTDSNGMYTLCIQDVSGLDTQVSLVKDSLGKDRREVELLKEDSKEERRRTPTIDEVASYCAERKNDVDPQRFVDYYTSQGWMVGNNPMKDWKACVRTWEKKDHKKTTEEWYENYWKEAKK